MFDSLDDAVAAFEAALESPGVLAALRVAKDAKEQFPDSAITAALMASALRSTGEVD